VVLVLLVVLLVVVVVAVVVVAEDVVEGREVDVRGISNCSEVVLADDS
jgi:hypothetical protein